MGAQPLEELVAEHAGPGTEREWAALPESLGRVELLDGALVVSPFPAVAPQRLVRTELGATSYSLTTNGFVASAQAAGGRLTLEGPFHADLDLAALATTRYSGQ